ncbi:oxidoreductase [Streptomyces sp. NPDC002082]|uniref:oxidoreductase n=1 Tax=Streptomyces sp. NPDC002082 TaxID=3154772 RepID=UPI00332DFE49
MTAWTAHDIPSQKGCFAVVTGANSGIGEVTATELARAGADVVLAGRSLPKLREAMERIRPVAAGVRLIPLALDLADLESVAAFSDAVLAEGRPLDLLVNNAGVMAIPERRTTKDGFELTVGTNHLGHFALTGHLVPALSASAAPRVVTVSAMVARSRSADRLNDLQSERRYRPMAAYAKSKLANVVFATELQRRARAADLPLLSAVVHPGTSLTGLQQHGSRLAQAAARLLLERLIGQPTDQAALPSLFAATSDRIQPGGFYGPTGRAEGRGTPGAVRLPDAASDPALGGGLWQTSERLTRVTYL